MSMISLPLDPRYSFENRACAECGAPSRLTGIEPHSTLARTDLHTFQCMLCNAVQAVVVPLHG